MQLIRDRLASSMQITRVNILDDSHLHAGHVGAKAGGGHYRLTVVSPDFEGLGPVQRHRLVYTALGDAMRADTIHALSIQAFTPDEDTHD